MPFSFICALACVPTRALHHLHRQQEAAESEKQRAIQLGREDLWQFSEPVLEQRKTAAVGDKALAR